MPSMISNRLHRMLINTLSLQVFMSTVFTRIVDPLGTHRIIQDPGLVLFDGSLGGEVYNSSGVYISSKYNIPYFPVYKTRVLYYSMDPWGVYNSSKYGRFDLVV